MYRCFVSALVSALLLPAAAQAQVQRNFPQNALRGDIVITNPPEVTLNDEAARLAPGARIRDEANMLVMSGALSGTGKRLRVNYTMDISGLVRDVWILRKEEIDRRPWPRTAQEAQTWSFNPTAQTWTKP